MYLASELSREERNENTRERQTGLASLVSTVGHSARVCVRERDEKSVNQWDGVERTAFFFF